MIPISFIALRGKLMVPTGRHLYAVLGTYAALKRFEACQAMDIDTMQFGDLHRALADTQLARALLLKMMQEV